MNDLIVSVVVIAVMASLGLHLVRRLPAEERPLALLSLVVHLVTGPLLLVIMDYVFVSSDVHAYFDSGSTLARMMRADFPRWAPEVLKYTLQIENDLGVLFPEEFGGLYATTSMTGATGWMMFLLNDAQHASFILMAGLAFAGKMAGYQAVRLALPGVNFRRVALAMLLVPSVVFWSSGVVKESFAVTGLGVLMLWVARASKSGVFAALHWLALGLLLVRLFKPYLLFPFALSAGVWLLIGRTRATSAAVKPIYVLALIAVMIGAIAALSVMFPEFSPNKIGESTAQLQYYGRQTEGGSNYNLGNAEATTLGGQLAFAPVAFVTVLFRPFLFEVRNFTMLIASAEVTVLMVLLVQLFRRESLSQVLSAIRRSPPLAYCFVFTVVAGLAIGLATSNFGTLSRYRIPMMQYYVLLVLALTERRAVVA
jgi:hypothetical protein